MKTGNNKNIRRQHFTTNDSLKIIILTVLKLTPTIHTHTKPATSQIKTIHSNALLLQILQSMEHYRDGDDTHYLTSGKNTLVGKSLQWFRLT